MRIFMFLSLLFTPAVASAQDHLIPEQSHFTDDFFRQTYSLTALRLGSMYGRDVFANVAVFPASSREYVVAFARRESGAFEFACMQTTHPMWDYQRLKMMKDGSWIVKDPKTTLVEIEQLEKSLPADPMEVEVQIDVVEMSAETGERLQEAWGRMLYETRYPKPETPLSESRPSFVMGHDGTTYHFSFFHDMEPLSGWAWGPPETGNVATLVSVVHAAKALCDEENAASRQEFEKTSKALADALDID